jgi:hypothetical protein
MEEVKGFTIRYADGRQVDFWEGEIVELKRINGRRLKNCEIEFVFEGGFVYFRRTPKRGSYSQVRFTELDEIKKEDEQCDAQQY